MTRLHEQRYTRRPLVIKMVIAATDVRTTYLHRILQISQPGQWSSPFCERIRSRVVPFDLRTKPHNVRHRSGLATLNVSCSCVNRFRNSCRAWRKHRKQSTEQVKPKRSPRAPHDGM